MWRGLMLAGELMKEMGVEMFPKCRSRMPLTLASGTARVAPLTDRLLRCEEFGKEGVEQEAATCDCFDLRPPHTFHHRTTTTSPPHLSTGIAFPSMPLSEPYITPHLPYRSNSEKLSSPDSGAGTPGDDYHAALDHTHITSRRPPTIGGGTDSKLAPAPQRSNRKQEIQNDFRHLATIGFTSLVMGT